MAFQIGIGDIVMLSKLAWTISQAFTAGRKSAPAEFKEVQNQVDSLCHALDSLKLLSPQHSGDNDTKSDNSIAPILENCRFTLEHLETLVNKYMIIDNQDDAGESQKKRWREEIRKDWRKVRWTSEGGDLARLQHNLGVHINSLNLTIAVLNSEKNQSIGHHVEDVLRMLQEIYVWFTSNLSGRSMSFQQSSPEPQEKPQELTFSLHPENPETYDTLPICDNASFKPEWFKTSNTPVFKCNCQLRRTMYGDIHDEELAQYFLSPMSLIVRLNGDSKSWKIWLSSSRTSRLTSLILRNITPSKLAVFENIVSELAIIAASPVIHRGMGSLMVLPSINPYTKLPVISVLNMLCETHRLYKCIENVKLTANGHSYSTGPIETVQLVHYRNVTDKDEWLFNETADVILNTNSNMQNTDLVEDDVSEFTLTVDNNTEIMRGENGSHVLISSTDCLSRYKDGQENMVNGVYAEIELLDGNSATYLVQQLRHLQEGLLLLKVQQIQRNEKLLFELGLELLMLYDYHLSDATLKLVINLKTKYYRLLFSNASKSICLSIEMSSKSLQKTAETSNLHLTIDNVCWVVESNLDGAHVYQHRNRSSLTCADTHTQKLLTLMLQSVVRGDHGIPLPIIEGS